MTLHALKLPVDALAEVQPACAADSDRSQGAYVRVGKRALDLALTLIAAPLAVPLVLTLALMILATGSRPFYSQPRLGKGGRAFRLWKLRTMVHDADQRLKTYLATNPAARAEWDATQKLRNDPRITPLGRLLRKTSIDELPQLFNVFNGTMSLVGPRPMMPDQEHHYHGQTYYRMRPGITGLWQVSDRNNCDFKDRAAFDNAYGRVVSLKTDVALLIRTIGVVCRATGH
jgi:lipopolysaccharide/colanic/teichoic acid biosynthesis glycosyltransferase